MCSVSMLSTGFVIGKASLFSQRSYSFLKQTYASSSAFSFSTLSTVLDNESESAGAAETVKNERTKHEVDNKNGGNQNKMINFSTNNDYLGLSSHPDVVSAGIEAFGKYVTGLKLIPTVRGTRDIRRELELKIARFHGRDDAIVYPTSVDANGVLFEVLLTPEDAVFSDELNNASTRDGIRLCEAQKFVYKHRDTVDLESQLKGASSARLKVIVSDGVFGMDGNIAPLKEILKLADKYNALICLDECNAAGFFGETGRGTEEYCGLSRCVGVINSTLEKAFGVPGNYTTGPKQLTNLLREHLQSHLGQNPIHFPVAASAAKAFDLVMGSTEYVDKVNRNTQLFRSRMTKAGFTVASENHPMCPVMLGDARLTSQFVDELRDKAIYVTGCSFPVVPEGKARIQVHLSASHTPKSVEKGIDAFISIGKKLNVIK